MSSASEKAAQLDKTRFKMVREVLKAAGLRGVNSEASSESKREASNFLDGEFRGGLRTKSGLMDALNRRKLSNPDVRIGPS